MKRTGSRAGKLPQSSGFTLVELLFTVGIVAVMFSLAVPGFNSLVANSQMTASVNDLIASMQLARSEAVKRATPVSVCRVSNSNSATPTCASGTGWHDGWVVFVDVNADATFDGGDEVVLRRTPAMGGTLAVSVPSGSAPLDTALTYMDSGFPNSSWPSDGSGRNMLFCDGRGKNSLSRVVNFSQTGRPQVRRFSEVSGLGIDCEE